jgi:hypothetical protein
MLLQRLTVVAGKGLLGGDSYLSNVDTFENVETGSCHYTGLDSQAIYGNSIN